MICASCKGWSLPGNARPLSQAGADNIGMDFRKQCFCPPPRPDRDVPETGTPGSQP